MTDIVERLRLYRDFDLHDVARKVPVTQEAADTIERLRAQNHELTQGFEPKLDKAKQYIGQLKEQLDKLWEHVEHKSNTIDQLDKEAERTRAGLIEIQHFAKFYDDGVRGAIYGIATALLDGHDESDSGNLKDLKPLDLEVKCTESASPTVFLGEVKLTVDDTSIKVGKDGK